ncbi:methyltransferase CmcJ [Colletotrichum kahawae]|uniref:Methyltransferase CmcJ n=1 Tax=Colletotrichum kahawae TaxID=34407 RepID=A0AAE0CXP1_COLKA|nr:methyltransferase CmcJ [Colletotrichum kahawae]
MACGVVEAEVDYLKRLPLYQREKPFQLFVPIHEQDPDARSTNLVFEKKKQTFTDIRERVGEFSLDSHGFQVETAPSHMDPQSFEDQELIKTRYLPEIEKLFNSLGSSGDKVFIFDWRLRDAGTPRERKDGEIDMNDLTTWLRPSPTVHVDQSAEGVLHRVLLHLPEEAPFLLQGRVRLINVWRPIENTVQDFPLACCDSSSILDDDLIECDHVRRKFKGSNLYAHHREGHKWYYLGEQRPDEVLLIKMFDSDSNVSAQRCPHVSFRHPSAPQDAKPRKSIEVRALVFSQPNEAD